MSPSPRPPAPPLRGPADPVRAAKDSRRPPRPGVRAVIRPAGSAADVAAGLSTVGPDGAAVRLSAAAAVGDSLEVGLVRADGRAVPPVRALVPWCRPLGGGLFAAGLEFDRRLGLAELADLV